MGRVKVLKILGLLTRDPTACFTSLDGEGWFLTLLAMVSEVSQWLCWSPSGKGQGARFSQDKIWPVLYDCSFLASGVCPLVGQGRLGTFAGFQVVAQCLSTGR